MSFLQKDSSKDVKSKIVREDLITQEDIEILLKGCRGNPRDKALLHVHYEAGTRPGEILNFLKQHVWFLSKERGHNVWYNYRLLMRQ